MVDFKKLKGRTGRQPTVDPRDLFQRLPRAKGINDLYASQAEVLRAWFETRQERRDHVIKLPTGGGKTLVGLLIGYSILNESRRPFLYLSPNRQLVSQIIAEARGLGIPAVPFRPGENLPQEFLSAEAICVGSYKALFNGQTKFGTLGGNQPPIDLGGILIDDAHAAFDEIRDAFTFSVDSENYKELYRTVAIRFKPDFQDIDNAGTFDDILEGRERTVVEVPYWAWMEKCDDIATLLRAKAHDIDPFSWPLIRDAMRFCHAFVSRRNFSITPMFPLLELFPSYDRSPQRIFMSATIADDSETIRTFNVSKASVLNPATSASLAGVGERMILIPDSMPLGDDAPLYATRGLVEECRRAGLNVVILAPSRVKAENWRDVAEVPTKDQVEALIQRLQSNDHVAPLALANRYEGVDLPGEACRLLILDQRPQGSSDYELFRAQALAGASYNSTLAQRIEQGIGRAARGAGDFCVVVLVGNDLVAWLGAVGNLDFLTAGTRKQIEIGYIVSAEITTKEGFIEAAFQCLNRDEGWVAYYADEISDAAELKEPDEPRLELARLERLVFHEMRQSELGSGFARLCEFADGIQDRNLYGWIKQVIARAMFTVGGYDDARELQRQAYNANKVWGLSP